MQIENISNNVDINTPLDFQKQIQEFRNSGNLIKAEEIAKNALNIFENNLILMSEYAWNSQVKNDYLEAEKRLVNLIKIHNGNVTEKMYSRLLSVYEKLNQFEELEILLEKALQKYPNSEKIKAYKTIEKKTDLSDSFEIIVLTTFPKHASNNVGDQLITYSFLKLLKKRLPDLKYHIEFRANNLDKYLNKSIKYILAPGFSISNEVYPKIYGLYSDLNNLPKFLPIGCSFQHISPSHEVFESNTYSDIDKYFFNEINKKMDFPFLCRDVMIYNMLVRNNIPSTYSGDMAIYDEDYLNTRFVPPENINSIVFTIGHHEKYEYQSYCLLTLIKNCFPNVKLYVSYHSKILPRSKKIGDFAVSLGYEEVFMFGDVENLNFYNNIDLHIGYRLHGHISFLRRRKPSILIVEDARSYGFANIIGTHIGCFNALNPDETFNNFAPIDAIKFVENEIKNEFKSYNEIFSFIDKTFNNTLLPIIDQLVLELQD